MRLPTVVWRSVLDTVAVQSSTADMLRGHASQPTVASHGQLEGLLQSVAGMLEQDQHHLAGKLPLERRARIAEVAASHADDSAIACIEAIPSGTDWPVSGMVRDAGIALAAVVSNLTLLHAIGVARGVHELTATTQRQLRTTAHALVELNLLLPAVVVDESARREPIAAPTDARERASRNVRAAWTGPRAAS